ncbi:hypothetical protein [Streptomyces sp. NPDC002588]|uniref:hypothetical protein n=1 Tax=Streptomyces sp. NPDC002588 TaxID=3154419 RepID=UPI003332EE7C
MARLLAGEPLHTDGAPTKENLAGWDARVARPVLRTPGEVQRDQTIADLRMRLREATTRVTELQGKLDTLATVRVPTHGRVGVRVLRFETNCRWRC